MKLKIAGLLCVVFITALAVIGCSAPQYQAPEGRYALTVGNDRYALELRRGHFRWEDANKNLILEDGSYRLDGNQLQFTVTMRTAEDFCQARENQFAYAWNFDGKALTMTKMQDPCARRAEIFDGKPWMYLGAPEE